tara:strand:- start:1845 stop:2087 length:243 start_codon:yes stop_codon:yes gene_type:complete
MNATQKKWFEQLEKCLSKMPKGVELAVTNAGGGYADIILLEAGKADSMMSAEDDMHLVDFGSASLSQFIAEKITVNSENL